MMKKNPEVKAMERGRWKRNPKRGRRQKTRTEMEEDVEGMTRCGERTLRSKQGMEIRTETSLKIIRRERQIDV